MQPLDDRAVGLHTVRVRARISAYIYGNMLVLGTLAEINDQDVEDGRAMIKVAVVTVTTFLSHVIAHSVAERVDRTPDEYREHASEHLADAVPILVSGIVPCVLLVLGQRDVFEVPIALALATLIPILRLASTGVRVARLTKEPTSRFVVVSGLGLAAAGLGVALLKLVG